MDLLEIRKDGKVYMHTSFKECIPPNEVLKSMKKAGYKVYMNGKIWKDKK